MTGFSDGSVCSGELSGELTRDDRREATRAAPSVAKATAKRATGISGVTRGLGVRRIASPRATAANASAIRNDDQNGTVVAAAAPEDRREME
jgi:hypothetical protein